MRCPKGFVQKPPKSGNCVAKGTKKVSKSKRCPKGTRKNKKTGECEGKSEMSSMKTMQVSSLKKTPTLTPAKKMYKITEIEIIYSENPEDFGVLIVNEIIIREVDNHNNFYVIQFDNGSPVIEFTTKSKSRISHESIDIQTFKNTINMKDLQKNSDVSGILFPVDEGPDFKYNTLGRKIKSNITREDLKNKIMGEALTLKRVRLNNLKETIKILKNL
jgi:hypothetical protein